MGSVKSLVRGRGRAGQFFRPPTPHSFGQGVWRVSGRFSVADLKGEIPPVEIRDKNFALAMAAGAYWEAVAGINVHSTYLGMFDHDGRVVTVADLLERGEISDLIAMRIAKTPGRFRGKVTSSTLATYHRRIKQGVISCYVADVECIFRFGFPLGSSFFKKVYKAAGRADYEDRATYDEVVAGLDEIRAISGILETPKMQAVLREAGVDFIPDPGYTMKTPVLGYTTKFDPAGDKDLTHEDMVERLGLDWSDELWQNARHQREFCRNKQIVNIDGKTEAVVVDGVPMFADFACTMDENRLMLPWKGRLIPSNKEIQRAIFRARGIYSAIERAKGDYGDDWLSHLYDYITRATIEEATAESVSMMGDAIAEVSNRLLGQDVFAANPISTWVGPFMPYASVVQTL